MNNIYIYKNTIFDLLNLIDYLINNNIIPNNIKDEYYNPTLLDNIINLNLDYNEKIIENIINKLGHNIFRIILDIYLSNDERREIIIFYFYKNSLKYGNIILHKYNLKCVVKALNISKYVRNEAHKYKGFVRFKELVNNVLYAEIEPVNNILILISNYFKKRLKNEYFIIKDNKRNILSIYDKNNLYIVNDDEFKLTTNKISKNELIIEDLWKTFYKTISIESRHNDKCRMNFMPKRYWKYLIEMSDELRNKMKIAINLLCNTVKTTLGPKGGNIIIDHSSFSPFITNDGVTIAKNIESEDIVINTILELAKEASIKTNETVGDGTTTTLVLLQSIFNEGLKLIDKGINPIILKQELNIALDEIVNNLSSMNTNPNKKDLLNIATTSSNDIEIGKIITNTYLKVKNINSIKIIESEKTYTTVTFNKGYSFETNLATLYYFKDKNELNITNPYILIFNTLLDDLNSISQVINEIINNKKELIIIAKDYSEELINQVISMHLDNIANIYLFKTPEYGINELIFLKDISIISNTPIIHDTYEINNIMIGSLKSIKINKNYSTIEFDKNENIILTIEEIKKQLNDNNCVIDKDFNYKRLSMFNSYIAIIEVGANTTTERREMKMRYDDALCAINTASSGIVLGSGIPLLKISNNLGIKNNAYKILKLSLSKPIEQILINSGLNKEEILKYIKDNEYNVLYNVKKDKYENIKETSVIDPINVITNSLTNAVSIASMLLTTSSLVINEYKNNLNKINDFNEL